MNRSPLRALSICLTLALIAGGLQATGEPPLLDKTLVVWASPANLTQAGGSALTVNDTTMDRFDGVVFGELTPQVWMPGSNGFSRTQKEQDDWPQETVAADQFVQMAIVYQGQQITVYRNGELYAQYRTDGAPYACGPANPCGCACSSTSRWSRSMPTIARRSAAASIPAGRTAWASPCSPTAARRDSPA